MSNEPIDLDMKKLRRSYEISRIMWALKTSAVIIPIAVISAFFCGNILYECIAALSFYTVTVFALWRGQQSSISVNHGFLMASIIYIGSVILCDVENSDILMFSNILLGLIAGIVLWIKSNSVDHIEFKAYLLVIIPMFSLSAFIAGQVIGSNYFLLSIFTFICVTLIRLLFRK